MKQILLVLLAVLILGGCSGMSQGVGRRAGLEGTWEHISPGEAGYRQIKLITPTHFVWATYWRDTGELVASGGGTYEFDGKTYIERIEFGSEPLLLDLIGRDQVFTATREGGLWHHEGTLTNGLVVSEVWRRLE